MIQQTGHVQDERHAAIAQNGGASDSLDLTKPCTQGFDHRLRFADQVIHDESDASTRTAHDENILARTVRSAVVEQITQFDERQCLPAQIDETAAAGFCPVFGRNLEAFFDDIERYAKSATAAGLHGRVFTSVDRFHLELRELGLDVR